MATRATEKAGGLAARLLRALSPPRFADEERDRLARVLNIVLLCGFLAIALTAAAAAAAGEPTKPAVIGASAAVLLLLQLPLRLGRVRLAIFLTFLFVLALMTVVLAIGSGIHDLGAMLYPVIIASGGLLLRPREFRAVILLCWLSAVAIIILEVAGLLSVPLLLRTSPFALLTVTAFFVLAAVPIRLMANDLNRHIARVDESERQLQRSNESLQRQISERMQAEAALRDSETRFRTLAESTFEGVCVSENGRVLDANNSLARMLARPLQDIIGRPIAEFLGTDATGFILEQAQSGGALPYEHDLRRPDGTLVPVESRIRTIPYQGRPAQVVTCLDISERRRSEEEHRILEAEIRQSQKLESLGTLAGGIAHDFNNIISIINGHAAVLAARLKGNPEAQAALQAIHEASERGIAMVKQILTFARKSEAEFRALHIQELLAELVKMLRVTFPRTVEIRLACPDDLPPVWMDPSQMHQALLNLCINARDAMSGSGRLQIRAGVIDGASVAARFPAAGGKRLVLIQVADTGVGMDERTRARIFEPFFTTKGRGRGTGLGLAVVYGVVQAHKGFIEVESQPQRGATFSLYFPASERRAAAAEVASQEEAPPPRGSETILVIEDEEDLRELLASMLHDHGYGILIARDGMEALERYRRHRDDIQLVITDMDLPKINGAAVSQSILSDDPRARIILISGFVEAAQKEEILASGVREFVAKPYTLAQMMRIVRKVLDEE
jgi:PAS domain S-box-containing protein